MTSGIYKSDSSGDQDNSFRHSPLEYVRTLYVAFIQGLFRASPPGAYHWSPNEDSEIVISDEAPIHVERLGQRPAVSVTRGPVRFATLGLDDMESYNFQTGSKRKAVLVPGTMSINCCSRAPIESERLAWIIAEQLWLNREELLRAGFFEIGRNPVIGAPSPAGSIVNADSGDEWYATVITTPFQFQRTGQRTPLNAEVLNGITLSIRENLSVVTGAGPVGTGGVEFPYTMEGARPASFAPSASDAGGGTPRPGVGAPTVMVAPHPLNPAQIVTVRSSRPYGPAVRPPSMGGRAIPLSANLVEESAAEALVTGTRTVLVQ